MQSLPYSSDAERAVIGLALRDKASLVEVMETVRPEHFYVENHKKVFRSIQDLYAGGEAVDMVTVGDRLAISDEDHGGSGSVMKILDIMELAPLTLNAGHYAEIVLRDYYLRETINACNLTIGRARHHAGTLNEFLDLVEGHFRSISQMLAGGSIFGVVETLKSAIERLETIVARDGSLSGVPTGFTDLDQLTGGFQGGHFVILAARPALGKTTLALNMALNAARQQSGVLLFSLEMSREELMNRLMSRISQVNVSKFVTGDLSSPEQDRIMHAAREIAATENYLAFDDSSMLTLFDVRSRCRRYREQGKLDLVIIDYITLMSSPGNRRYESKALEVAALSKGLKALAKELNIPILALAQLNRDVEKSRTARRPRPSDLKESGSLEQDADIVLLLHRDQSADEMIDGGTTELIVGKNRHGATPLITLAWRPEFASFLNLN